MITKFVDFVYMFYSDLNNKKCISQNTLVFILMLSTYRCIVTATDQGKPPKSSTTVVDIIYTEVPTTTTTIKVTTIPPEDFFSKPGNLAWIIILSAILGTLLLALLLYLCFRFCPQLQACRNTGNCCKPSRYVI